MRSAMRSAGHKLDAYATVATDRLAIERRVAELLPTPPVAAEATRGTGLRESIIDWLGRPFGHDSALTAANLAGSGGGRGIGTVAVALCLGGTVAGGSY